MPTAVNIETDFRMRMTSGFEKLVMPRDDGAISRRSLGGG
jgi:hypothetical protein